MTLREAEATTETDREPVELDQTSVGRLSRADEMQQQAMAATQARRRAARLRVLEAAIRRIDELGCRLEIDRTATRCVASAGGQR